MNDNKIFHGKDGTQVGEWRRVYTSPNASIDCKIDPFSSRDFVEKTGRKKDNYGSLLDRAKEASLARTQKEGRDVVKEKWLKNYEITNGVKHFDSSKDKVVKKNGVTIDFGAK
jgi:hypothetical protein